MSTAKLWSIFAGLALVVFMLDVDMIAINLALPTIAHYFSLTLSQSQWLVNGYLIAAASLMIFSGRLADNIGARQVFIRGTFGFFLTSLLVGLAQTAEMMIAARLLQGMCLAFTLPIAAVLIRQIFPPQQTGFAVGMIVAIAGIAQSLGPTIGGFIIHTVGWRWIFLINLPLCLLSYSLVSQLEPSTPKEKIKIAYSHAFFLIVALVSLITTLNQAPTWGLGSIKTLSLMFIAIITMGIFIQLNRSSKAPLLDNQLFQDTSFILVNVVRLFVMMIYLSLLFTLGILLQAILPYSPLHAGLILLAMTLMFGALSIPMGRLIDKIGYYYPLIIAMLIFATGCLLLSKITLASSTAYITSSLMLCGIAIAIMIPGTATALMHNTPKTVLGSALGFFFTNGFIGGSLGVALSGLLMRFFGGRDFPTEITQSLSSVAKTHFISGFSSLMLCWMLLAIFSSYLCYQLRDIRHA